ncbi:MAG TPA: selenium cofactor biosynthesis protein YqeC [Atribacterota bacterium]|nr:selenium cofactor biosynthesis protein YqeC [Atribacterota bacterium]
MYINTALQLKDRAFISLIGAGGKSSILQILARELLSQQKKIIVTTTTKMFTSQANTLSQGGKLIESSDSKVMEETIQTFFKQHQSGIVALLKQRFLENEREKFTGPESCYLNKWWQEGLADFFIIEADGAKGRPIKAPLYYEPVIPQTTTDVVGVIGIDAVGLRLEEENVFRSSLFSCLTGLKHGEEINMDTITKIVNHPFVLYKNSPQGARVHLFLNKVNNKARSAIAEELACQILKNNKASINNIVIGDTIKEESPVQQLLKSEKVV